MHFFEDNPTTIQTLTNSYKYSRRSVRKEGDIEISLCYGNGTKVCVWTQNTLAAFIDQQGGRVLEMENTLTDSDSAKKVTMWICIVAKK